MPFIKITRQTFLSGQVANVGEVFEVDEDTAKQTVALNKGELTNPPEDAIIEPPKPKVKKVKGKEDEE